ncbi:MAG: DUF4334 domain-containing protein [bacterium]
MKPSETFKKLIQQKGKISCAEMEEFFAQLDPVSIDDIIGQWKGKYFPTGGKMEFFLKDFVILKWHGKQFISQNRVKSLVYSLLGLKFNILLGTASLRMVEYKKKLSVGMIYNYFPMIDYFRKIDDTTVMGIMEVKGKVSIYFYLKRDA